jgi:hypothetical protein
LVPFFGSEFTDENDLANPKPEIPNCHHAYGHHFLISFVTVASANVTASKRQPSPRQRMSPLRNDSHRRVNEHHRCVSECRQPLTNITAHQLASANVDSFETTAIIAHHLPDAKRNQNITACVSECRRTLTTANVDKNRWRQHKGSAHKSRR